MKKTASMGKYYQIYLITIVIGMIINLPIWYISVTKIHRQEQAEITASVKVLLSNFQKETINIDRFMSWSVANDESFKLMTYSSNITEPLKNFKNKTIA